MEKKVRHCKRVIQGCAFYVAHTIVRTNLEYGMPTCSPSLLINVNHFKRIQNWLQGCNLAFVDGPAMRYSSNWPLIPYTRDRGHGRSLYVAAPTTFLRRDECDRPSGSDLRSGQGDGSPTHRFMHCFSQRQRSSSSVTTNMPRMQRESNRGERSLKLN